MVARVAARRGLEARARHVEPRPTQDRLQLRADRRAEALELLRGRAVHPRPRVEPARRELHEQPPGVAVGAVLERPLVAREAQVAMLAEHLHVAAAELQQQVLERLAQRALVNVARSLPVLARVVALEPLEPRERLRAESVEHAVELRT